MTARGHGPPAASSPRAGAVGGILLAAGGGRRFGGPKAAAEFRGELLVERGVRLLAEGGCRPVVVVLGAEASAVRRRARLGGALVRDNPGWRSGMASSLQAGLDALEGRCDAAVVVLVDQPLVGPRAIRRLAAAWRDGAPVAVATYGGHRRNPVLFDRAVWPDVRRSLAGDVGARAWLDDHADRVVAVTCDGTGSPADADTPADLAALAEQAQTKEDGRAWS